jgi:hypothetical protein
VTWTDQKARVHGQVHPQENEPPENIYPTFTEAPVGGIEVKRDDEGITEVVDETLIIALGLALAVIVAVIVFGVFKPIDKSAYLVPQFGVGNFSGHTVITIFDRNGDPVYFNDPSLSKYHAVLYVDTPSGSYKAATAPTLSVLRPGDTIYAYYTGSGFVLTDTLAGLTFPSLPGGKITVKFVDETSGVIIAREDLILAATPSPTPTATTSITATPATTTAATTVTGTSTTTAASTTTTTTTTTTTGSTKTITVRWSPNGLGYGSLSPPARLTNSQEVRVSRGSSQTIYFVPNSNKAVLTIRLDGTTVYSGSSVGSTISYTVPNIVEDRELTATIG